MWMREHRLTGLCTPIGRYKFLCLLSSVESWGERYGIEERCSVWPLDYSGHPTSPAGIEYQSTGRGGGGGRSACAAQLTLPTCQSNFEVADDAYGNLATLKMRVTLEISGRSQIC